MSSNTKARRNGYVLPTYAERIARNAADRAASLALAGLLAPDLPAAVAGLDQRVTAARTVALLDRAPMPTG